MVPKRFGGFFVISCERGRSRSLIWKEMGVDRVNRGAALCWLSYPNCISGLSERIVPRFSVIFGCLQETPTEQNRRDALQRFAFCLMCCEQTH